MAENLLPCPNPWCDSGVQPMSFAMRGGFHQVICGCDFKGPRKATKEETEAAWNRRPAPMEAVAWREKLADAAYVVLRHSDYRPGTDNGLIPHDDRLVPLAIADVILALIATQPAD